MRILHIITRLIVGGAQENTLLTCQDLRERFGDEVLLVTGPALGPEGSLIESAVANGVSTDVVDELRRAVHPWRDWCAERKIREIIGRFKPDVVHTHSAKAGILGRRAAWNLAVPCVVHTVHGAPFYPYQSGLARTLIRGCEHYAARRCHHLISVADAMTDLLVEANVTPREKFTTIYSGMDVDPFLNSGQHRQATRRELNLSDDDIAVGKVARLFHLKGHEYVVAAARQVLNRCPRAKFVFIGDGILRESLQEAIRSAGMAEKFIFTGLVPPARLPDLIGAMDMVVHASLREGLARVLPQALIAGRPVVSYDIDGAREVVIPDETGFLIPPKSVDELADAISRLAEDAKLRERFGEEGRRRFTDRFRHERMTEQIRGVYGRVLGK